MKKFLKKFPLTVYLIFASTILVLLFTFAESGHEQSGFVFLILLLLALPSLPVLWLYKVLPFENIDLLSIIILPILLDLILLSLRTGSLKNFFKKTYHKFTKPKK